MVRVLEGSVNRIQLSLDKPQQGEGGDLKSAHKLFSTVCDSLCMLHEWRNPQKTWPLCSWNGNTENREYLETRWQQKFIREEMIIVRWDKTQSQAIGGIQLFIGDYKAQI